MRLHMFSLGPVTPRVKLFYLAMLAAPLTIATFGAVWSAHLVSSGREPLVVVVGFAISAFWVASVERQTESHRHAVMRYFKHIRNEAKIWKRAWKAKAAEVHADA